MKMTISCEISVALVFLSCVILATGFHGFLAKTRDIIVHVKGSADLVLKESSELASVISEANTEAQNQKAQTGQAASAVTAAATGASGADELCSLSVCCLALAELVVERPASIQRLCK